MVEKHNINHTTTYNEMFFQISYLKEEKNEKNRTSKGFWHFCSLWLYNTTFQKFYVCTENAENMQTIYLACRRKQQQHPKWNENNEQK